MLEAVLAASVRDEDAVHGLGSGSEEVGAAIPVLTTTLADEAQVCLVDEGGRFERLPRRFVGHPVLRLWTSAVLNISSRRGAGLPG
jgi:hypothetical protein